MIHRAVLETVDHYAECIYSICESLFSGQKPALFKKRVFKFSSGIFGICILGLRSNRIRVPLLLKLIFF